MPRSRRVCLPHVGIAAGLLVGASVACGGLVGADFDGWSLDAPGADAQPPEGDGTTEEDGSSPADGEPPDEPADAAVDALPDGGCPGGRTKCGNTCYDTQTHDSHCGGCGIKCKVDEDCLGGQCKKTATLSACELTPLRCSDVCAALNKVCAAGCGASNAMAIAYDEFDTNCSGNGVNFTNPNLCGVDFSDNDHGSVRCCCASP